MPPEVDAKALRMLPTKAGCAAGPRPTLAGMASGSEHPTRDRVVGVLIVVAAISAVVVLAHYVNAAVVTAAVALIIFTGGEFFTRRRTAQQYRWDKIAPTYEGFIQHLRHTGNLSEKEARSPEEQQRAEEIMGEFSDKLLLWGSPEVVKAWVDALRLMEAKPNLQGTGPVLAYAQVLLAIRKDLGQSDGSLDARDLLRVVVSDIDKHLSAGTRL
jgi:hypothetical protein